jgi:serine/threonine protein kinase
MSSTTETSLIGEGAYGWIFYPAIPSSNTEAIRFPTTMVSKVFLEKESADTDYYGGLLMTNNKDADKHMIIPKGMYELSYIDLCSTLTERTDTKALTKLTPFDSSQIFYQVIYEGKGEVSYQSFITDPCGFDLVEALDYIIQITKSIEYFVENKLIHNDVKPGNVIITNGETRFIDFGMSSRFANYAQNAQEYPDDYNYWPIEKQLYASISDLTNPHFCDLVYGISEQFWNDKIKNKSFKDISNLINGSFKKCNSIPYFFRKMVNRVIKARVLMPSDDELFYKSIKEMNIITVVDSIDTFKYITDQITSLQAEFIGAVLKKNYPYDTPSNEEFLTNLDNKKTKHDLEMNKLNEQFNEFYNKIDVFGLGILIRDTISKYRQLQSIVSDENNDILRKLEPLADKASHINVVARFTPTELLAQLEMI